MLDRLSYTQIVFLGLASSLTLSLASLARGWPFPTLSAAPWFVQWQAPNAFARYGALLVFALGMIGLCLAWWVFLRRENDLTPKRIWQTFALWAAPLLFSTPLSSGDVYVYYVDGQALARGVDLYNEGVAALGSSPLVHMVHPLWRDTNTMYGPFSMRLGEWIVRLASQSVPWGVFLFRLVSLGAVILGGLVVGSLTSSVRKRWALAFALLNPITLVHLVSGAHNDALMVGFVLLGLWLGVKVRGHGLRDLTYALGALMLCSVAAAFKLPAFTGVFVLGWIWAGKTATLVKRIVLVFCSGTVGFTFFALQTELLGMSWGWLNATKVPGIAHPFLAPVNAVGAAIGRPFGAENDVTSWVRGLGTFVAVVVSSWLILRTHRFANTTRVLRGFGLALLLIAWMSPALYPWYFAWGMFVVAVFASPALERGLVLLVLGVVWFVLPGGYGLLDVPTGGVRTFVAWLTSGLYVGIGVMVWRSVGGTVGLRRFFSLRMDKTEERSLSR